MSCLAVGLALSLHFGLEQDYNQVHPYVKCETERTVTGLYYNSLDTLSAFGAVNFPLVNKYTEEELSIDVGLVSGYLWKYDVAPMVRLNYNNMFVMPALEGDTKGLVFGFNFDF